MREGADTNQVSWPWMVRSSSPLLSYSIVSAKLIYLSKMSRKYLVRHLSNSQPGQTGTLSAQNQLTCLNLMMQCWQKKSVSDSKQCWSETEGRIVDLAINSWRCSKQAGQLIRFAGDYLKLICDSAMAMMMVMSCNGVRGLL